MNKDNNYKSWPYKEFHDANKSNSKNNLIWDSRSYEYSNSGEIKKIYLKWGPKTANSPGSYVDKASCTGTTQEYNALSIKLGSL